MPQKQLKSLILGSCCAPDQIHPRTKSFIEYGNGETCLGFFYSNLDTNTLAYLLKGYSTKIRINKINFWFLFLKTNWNTWYNYWLFCPISSFFWSSLLTSFTFRAGTLHKRFQPPHGYFGKYCSCCNNAITFYNTIVHYNTAHAN